MRRANKRALRAATGPVKAMADAVLLTLAGCAPGQAVAGPAPHGETKMEKNLFAEGVQRLTFSDGAGPAMPVRHYRAPYPPADAPALCVCKGALRDAKHSGWQGSGTPHP